MGRISTASSRRSAAFFAEWKWLTPSIAHLQRMRSLRFRFASRARRWRPASGRAPLACCLPEACVPKARNRKMTSLKLIQVALLAAILCSLTACSDALPDEPTPEAARQFLQLRGYQFDEKSFFKAAENRDVMAINGFIAASMKPGVKDENGDTALTLAADRGDAAVADTLLKRGADVNAKGRSGWKAPLLALHDN